MGRSRGQREAEEEGVGDASAHAQMLPASTERRRGGCAAEGWKKGGSSEHAAIFTPLLISVEEY